MEFGFFNIYVYMVEDVNVGYKFIYDEFMFFVYVYYINIF